MTGPIPDGPSPDQGAAQAPGPADAVVVLTGHATVRAALADPRFAVPPVPAAGDPDTAHRTTAWLRASVARFTNGATHRQRRAYVVERLDSIAPVDLRVAAAAATDAVLADRERPTPSGHAGAPLDVMADLARRVPLRVLGSALGVSEPDLDALVGAVIRIAPAYQPGAPAEIERRADDAVGRAAAIMDTAFPGADAEAIANLVAILVQTCDATAGLIGNTAAIALATDTRAGAADLWPDAPLTALVHETLRLEPAVRGTRRRTTEAIPEHGIPAATSIVLDFAGANRDPEVFADPDTFDPTRGYTAHLTFGHGLRPCPGQDHALAIACGVLEPLICHYRRVPTTAGIAYEPHPVLRIPARLEVTPR